MIRLRRLDPASQQTMDPVGLFERVKGRPIRVVIDPRMQRPCPDPLIEGLISSQEVAVGTIGRTADCTVVIGEPDRERDGLTLRRGTSNSAIYPLSRLEGYADARAEMYQVEPAELREFLVYLEAAAAWDADIFISDSPALWTPEKDYSHSVHALQTSDAVSILALLLRSRGECIITRNSTSTEWWPPWRFYRVAAGAALLPATRALESASSHATGVAGEGDWAGMQFYGDPVEAIIGRFSLALRARDRLLSAVLALAGNESHDVALYEYEALALQLDGTLDATAGAVNEKFDIGAKAGLMSWRNKKFGKLVEKKAGSESPPNQLPHWCLTSKILSITRNRIHGQPLQPVAGDSSIWFVLPPDALMQLRSLTNKLGGLASWGTRESIPGGVLLDPWIMGERSMEHTLGSLCEIALWVAGSLAGPARGDSSPRDNEMGRSALRALALPVTRGQFDSVLDDCLNL